MAAALLGAPAGWLAWRVTGVFEDGELRPSLAVMIALALAVFIWAAIVAPVGWVLAASLVLAWTLICLAAIDAMVFRLPDPLTLPLLAAGLAASFALPGAPVLDHLAGAAGGYAVLAGLAWAWRALARGRRHRHGRRQTPGRLGAWLGWRPLPSVVVIACAVALVWVAVMALSRRAPPRGAKVAFGVPLSLATWIVWLHGPLIS